jgi:hypothetical protein
VRRYRLFWWKSWSGLSNERKAEAAFEMKKKLERPLKTREKPERPLETREKLEHPGEHTFNFVGNIDVPAFLSFQLGRSSFSHISTKGRSSFSTRKFDAPARRSLKRKS